LNRADFRPARTDGKIDLAVPVDVIGIETDVIEFELVFENHVRRPARVFEPDQAVLRQGDRVEFAVAVDVGGRHRVADLADVRVEYDLFEDGKLRRRGGLC